MIKILIAALFMVAALFVLPSTASAQTTSNGTLRHAYKPVQVGDVMQARVNNHTSMHQKRLVCVEAMNNNTKANFHRGCLMVDLAPMGSTTAHWAMEFRAPMAGLPTGTYTVMYNYQDDAGNWHRIKSVTMQVQDGTYVAP